MKWGLLTVLVVGLALLFGAPFLDFLAPSENIVLTMFNPDTEKYTIIATGAETLWYQWQSWAYIVSFCLVLSLCLGSIDHLIRAFSDRALIAAKQKLAKKTQGLEQLQREYQHHVEQTVRHEYREEATRLTQQERLINELQQEVSELYMGSREHLKMANNATRRQQQETQSKLGQRDRLRDEKKCIAEFLDQINWTFTDGSKLTYSALKKLAKENENKAHKKS